MKRLDFFIALAVMLPVLIMLNVSPADSTNADNQTITSQTEASNSSTGDEIYALRIDNINKNGAYFHWSTSVATNGSVEYGYTKVTQQYNPQSSGSPPSVLINVAAKLVKSDSDWVRDHHIRVDNLDMYYNPFVEYTIKSATPGGEVYTLSGEFVLVDTQILHWWQSPYFVVPLAVIAVAELILTIRSHIQLRKAKKAIAPLD